MGKRSNFERRKNDFYETPEEAVLPLLPFVTNPLWGGDRFYEPCVGRGQLAAFLSHHELKCMGGSDIELDARTTQYDTSTFTYFITNPPWTRELLHPIIENLSNQCGTWLLFDADWMHTKQAQPYLKHRCTKIVSVGRVKWIPDSPYVGKDNACWYQFYEYNEHGYPTQFYGR